MSLNYIVVVIVKSNKINFLLLQGFFEYGTFFNILRPIVRTACVIIYLLKVFSLAFILVLVNLYLPVHLVNTEPWTYKYSNKLTLTSLTVCLMKKK